MGKKSKRTARKNSAAKVSTSSAAAAAKATEVSGPGTTEAQVTLVRDRTAAAAKVTKVRGLDITTDQVVPIAQALQLDAHTFAFKLNFIFYWTNRARAHRLGGYPL
jgi:hypothetical protein